MNYARLGHGYGRQSANRLSEAGAPGIPGARAALESFYYAFNNGSLEALRQVWIPDPLIRLNNPLGGVTEGSGEITALYDRIFNGPAEVWVEFHDIVEYPLGADAVAYAGRERGQFSNAGRTVDLDIRTTRLLAFRQGRWGQVHHHGSITDPGLLARYQGAVMGGDSD